MNFVFAAGDAFKKRKRTFRACERCRKRRIRCQPGSGTACVLCQDANVECEWSDFTAQQPAESRQKQDEDVYETALSGSINSQFVCATQPLAALLSKDPVMSVDGETLGFYLPWKDPSTRIKNIDPDLYIYLKAKGTFRLPPLKTQQRLIALFLEHVYPLYPVVDRSSLKKLSTVPPLILNAIMLAATRYDDTIENRRTFAKELHKRCDLLTQVERDKIIVIQAHLLMSIDEEGTQGANVSSELIWRTANLCIELSLQISDVSDTSAQAENRALLTRIFWTSFCCDRFGAITSGRALIYNTVDFVKKEPCLSDFETKADFVIFRDWYELQKLNGRIVAACYRPPANRVKDATLERDLTAWSASESLLKSFLQFSHSSSMILYYRTQITSLSFIERPRSTAMTAVFDSCNRVHTDLPNTHHISVIHAILHSITIFYIDILLGNSESNDGFEKCLLRLDELKSTWWLAASSYLLCKRIKERLIHRQDEDFSSFINDSTTLNDIDLMALLFPDQITDLTPTLDLT